jgi:hypothetical protein
MASAYDHLPPFRRLRYYIGVKLHDLKEVIDRAEAESRMWNEPEVRALIARLPYMQQGFFDLPILQAGQIRDACKQELEMWQLLYDSMDACPKCNGAGEQYIMESQDEGHYKKCGACGGSGQKPVEVR